MCEVLSKNIALKKQQHCFPKKPIVFQHVHIIFLKVSIQFLVCLDTYSQMRTTTVVRGRTMTRQTSRSLLSPACGELYASSALSRRPASRLDKKSTLLFTFSSPCALVLTCVLLDIVLNVMSLLNVMLFKKKLMLHYCQRIAGLCALATFDAMCIPSLV